MVLRAPITYLLVVWVSSVTFGASSFAQTPTPSNAASKADAMPVRSAFDGYRAHSDEPVSNWRAANDNVARIGGWREYARQAQSDQADRAEGATPPRPGAQDAKPGVKALP